MPRPPVDTTLLGLATSAYSSFSSCRQYREDFARVLTDTGLAGTVTIDKVRQFFDHPGFVAALRRRRPRCGRGVPRRGRAPGADPRPVLDPQRSRPTMRVRSGPRDVDFGDGGAYAAQHLAVAAYVMERGRPRTARGAPESAGSSSTSRGPARRRSRGSSPTSTTSSPSCPPPASRPSRSSRSAS